MDHLHNAMEQALATASSRTNMSELAQNIHTMANHQAPTYDAILGGVNLGDAGVMNALLCSPRLSRQERAQLATDGMLAWCDNPLASRQPEALFQVLVQHGADLSVRAPRSATIAERVAERLGKIEGNERRMKVAGKLKFSTAPCKILTQCFEAMVASGANMVEAQRVRIQAGRLVAPVVQTKHQKPASESMADFTGAAVPNRLGPSSMR